MISIIIPVFNQLPFTRLCLLFLEAFTERPYEIIIVDNGSTDDTAGYLKKRAGLKVITFPSNRGYTAACNAGITAARGRYLVLLNNDIFVTPRWLSNLQRILDTRPDVGMALPVTNLTYGPQMIQVSYPDLEVMLNFARRFNNSDPDRWRKVERLPDYCLIIRRELVQKIGLLDERFHPGYFEDDDYSYRARRAGYRLVFTEDTFVHHFSGVTTSGVDRSRTMGKRNRERFMDKWNFDPVTRFQLNLRVLDPLPDGLLLQWKERCFFLEKGKLRPVNRKAWLPLLGPSPVDVTRIPVDLLNLYPPGLPVEEGPLPDGVLLMGEKNELFLVHDKLRRRITDPSIRDYLLSQRSPLLFKTKQMQCIREGPAVEIKPGSWLPDGLLFDAGRILVSSGQMLRPLTSQAVRRWGYGQAFPIPLAAETAGRFARGPAVREYAGIPLDLRLLEQVVYAAGEMNRKLPLRAPGSLLA